MPLAEPGLIVAVGTGGTSADICLLKDGEAGLTRKGKVGVWPMPLPMVDMVAIGAGGGSVARVEDGALLVGSGSARSDPGPACYGKGGQAATVTDAHVVLGHLPANLLGGRMPLDPALAADAVERIASPLGLSLHEAARGILVVADNAMIGAIRGSSPCWRPAASARYTAARWRKPWGPRRCSCRPRPACCAPTACWRRTCGQRSAKPWAARRRRTPFMRRWSTRREAGWNARRFRRPTGA